MDQIGSVSELGTMFQSLKFVKDKKRKGRRIIVALEDNWRLTPVLMLGGVAIQSLPSYATAPTSLFMQSTNCSKSSRGFLCVACPNVTTGFTYRLPRLSNRRTAGILHHAFLAIPQVFFFQSGKMMIAFHRLDPIKTGQKTVKETMNECPRPTDFVKSVFKANVEVLPESNIEFIPLNSIAGPAFHIFGHVQQTHLDSSGDHLIEMRSHPDVWSNVTLDKRSLQLDLFVFASCVWTDDEGLLTTKRKRQKKSPFTRLLRSSCTSARVYFCRPTLHASGADKSSGLVYPYALDLTSVVRQFAELTVSQEEYVKCVFEDYEHITTTQYNSMLDHLLSASGHSRIKTLVITVGKHRKERTYVSIIGPNEVPEGCARVTGVDNVWEKTMLDSRQGVLSIDQGTVVQQIYQWPFQNNLSLLVVKLFRMGHQGTKRRLTRIKHLYQNFGRHSTSQCAASLGAHPISKQNHDQWTWKNNVNIAHQAMPSVVHGLRKESQIVTMACGSVFASSLNSMFEGQMDDIYSQCLITDTHACSRHTDPDFFSLKDSESITDCWKKMDSKALCRCLASLQSTYPQFGTKLPMETTCAWTIPERCPEYHMSTCFLNLTAGIGVDTSSTAYDYLDTVGSTFLGPCFEHCSTHPIWVHVSDDHVRVTPPVSAPCYVPFAWGTHGERARVRAQRRRQMMRRHHAR